MKILMISEGNITYDGRLIELYNSIKTFADITLVSIADSESDRLDVNHNIIKKRYGKFKKLFYVVKSLKIAQKTEFDVLFIDNTEACIGGLAIIKYLKPKKIILDSRELYLKGDCMSWKMKVLTFFERRVIKKADIHICANKYRAELMKKIYRLKNLPITFENIRLISELPEVDYKYSEQFNRKGITRILSTGGLSKDRAWPIINAMKKLGENYELYILGKASEDELNKAKQIIQDMNLDNVFIVGKKRRSIMRYFIQKCDIGVVYYSGKNMNEKLCASGKIYEYMQEMKPFIGPKLLPIEDLCKEYGIGECEEDLAEAILKIKNNYQFYQKNVEKYMTEIDVKKNNYKLAQQIKNYLYVD